MNVNMQLVPYELSRGGVFMGYQGELKALDMPTRKGRWEFLSKRERRWWARSGRRGRRGASRVAPKHYEPGHGLPQTLPMYEVSPSPRFDPLASYATMSVRTVVLERKNYEVGFMTPCPYAGRAPECTDECWRSGNHGERATAILYADEHARYARQLEQILQAELRTIQWRLHEDSRNAVDACAHHKGQLARADCPICRMRVDRAEYHRVPK